MPSIRIADGIVRYRDLRTGTLIQSDQIQFRISQRSGKELGLQARGSFAYGGETVKLEVGTDVPADRRARGLERIVMRLDGRHGQARYDGSVSLADRPILIGAIDVATPSARDAVRWFGKSLLREGGVVGPVALKGRIDSQEGRTTVEQMDLTLEGVRVGGRVAVDHARRAATVHRRSRFRRSRFRPRARKARTAPVDARIGAAGGCQGGRRRCRAS